MKKFLIGATALGLSLALVGCGNSANNAAITNLSSQLDDTANTISSIQTVNPTDLNMTKENLETIASKDSSGAIYDNVIGTQQALLNEEYYKMDILNKTAMLKSSLSKDLKLSKAQINAMKELTNNLDKYTNSVAYTKTEMNSTVKSISSLKKNLDKNSDRINAKLNRLACNSNTRSAYYENILSTLNQIGNYLNCDNSENEENQIDSQNLTQSETSENQKRSNIDTYLPNQNNQNNCENCEQEDAQNETPSNPNYNPNFQRNGKYFNGMGRGFNENYPNAYGANNFVNMPYGNAPYAGNSYYGNPYYRNGAFGYGYGANSNTYNFGIFNPTRNTDTYAPMMRNLDTYRLPANENAVAPVTTSTPAEENDLEKLEEKVLLEEETADETSKEVTNNQNDEVDEIQETSNTENLNKTIENPSEQQTESEKMERKPHHVRKLKNFEERNEEIIENNNEKSSSPIRIVDVRKTVDEELAQPTIAHKF